MKPDQLTVGWFDYLPIIMLAIGFMRGRKRGISQELLDFFQWMVIIFGGAFGYMFLAGVIQSTTGLGDLWARVLAYSAIAGLAKLAATLIKHFVGEKLMEGDTFGPMEYYLGMVAGAIRFQCMLLLGLAILNAPKYNQAEIQASVKSQESDLGMTLIPHPGLIQKLVFAESFTGRLIKQHASFLLIEPAAPGRSSGDGIGRQRERTLDQVIDPKGR